MLWYKAWLESRGRFAFGIVATSAACAFSWYTNRVTSAGVPRLTFIVCCFLFGMGGLLREQAVGTAPLTLALPVSRLHIVATRAAVGWAELVALALLAALFTPWPTRFFLLWLAGGSALFSVAFFASCVFAGEYTPFVVAWIVFFGHTTTTQYVRLLHPVLRPYLFTAQEIMSRLRPFPTSMAVAALAVVACSLIGAAAWWTNRRDF